MVGKPFYAPSPVPQSGDPSLRQWCIREFERIADAIRQGSVQFTIYDVQHHLPTRPSVGMAMYFAADVVSSGSEEGLYEYSTGAWFKL